MPVGKGRYYFHENESSNLKDGKYLTGTFNGLNSDRVEMHYSESQTGFGKFVNGNYIEMGRSDLDDKALYDILNEL